MGKLGKKARKFAKKHLQSVLRQRRKTKALFKRRSSKGGQNGPEEQEEDNVAERSNGRITKFEDFANISLDAIFIGDNRDEPTDMSDSDGYLTEDSDFPSSAASEMEKTFEDEVATSTYSEQNKKIAADLAVKMKKLDKLRKKDPDFNEFLESHNSVDKIQNEDEYSDEDDLSNQEEQGNGLFKGKKLLTHGFIDRLCQMVEEDGNSAALVRLLNAYRAACHYGAESIGHMIESSEAFCKIVLFTLSNAASIIRNQLHISSSNSTNDTILKLKNSKFKEKPVVKSFVRSTLFLLNQLTDTDILALAMTRIRASLIFFGVFPSLMQRLIKTTVHLWATGERTLSLASYLVIWDIASIFGFDYYEICLSNTLVAFISKSRLTEIADINHMQYLRDCTLELCSLDVEKSSLKAVASITQLAKILSLGLRTKEEAVGRLCSWEYVNCIDLWVMFVSANICDYDDLQPLYFMIIKLINGLAYMLPGPRYFPLRLKCIQWLNRLSRSSGKFIPITSLVLDVLEYKFTEEGRRAQKISNVASALKLPKHYLKSRSFQEECFHSSVEQLSLHFSQWAYHISFPDLATATLICLRKIHESTTVESLRRTVRRFLDQVEQNVDFVQKKRDEVSFSPHEHQSVDSFLQFEKCSLNTSFSQYYRSMLEKAAERNLINSGKTSSQKQKILKRKEADPKSNMGQAKQKPQLPMQYLAYIGGRSNKDGERTVEQKVLESNPVLEAFGNAKTVKNNNSSRFGKFVEIQFDHKGRISGAAIRTYLLERSRVCQVSDPERNYPCFFMLCAAPPEVIEKFKLGKRRMFHYLNQSNCYELDGINDSKDYINTRKTMDTVGMSLEEQDAIFRVVAAILHLGNIEFVKGKEFDSSMPKHEQSLFHLRMAAELFMVL